MNKLHVHILIDRMIGLLSVGIVANIDDQEYIDIVKQVVLIRESCSMLGLTGCVETGTRLIQYAESGESREFGGVKALADNLREDIRVALSRRIFLYIQDDRSEYVDNEKLFGATVFDAFPSAQRDIKEAGNCLAVECGTACVFHLMRASEFSMRALARDRGVQFADKPLEEKEWGQILPNLDAKITALRMAANSNWPPGRKDEQLRFYSDAVQELRGFNDAWRRHVSHADSRAFYERDEALGVYKHVRLFMQKLATKISEASVTDEYWK